MLTYRGYPVRRIQFMSQKDWKEAMYFVDTAELSCIVPISSIKADGGAEEVIQVAARTRGNEIPGERV